MKKNVIILNILIVFYCMIFSSFGINMVLHNKTTLGAAIIASCYFLIAIACCFDYFMAKQNVI